MRRATGSFQVRHRHLVNGLRVVWLWQAQGGDASQSSRTVTAASNADAALCSRW